MNTEKLKQVLDYCDVYEFIAAGTDSMKSLDEEMREAVNSSALQRRRKWISESPAYLTIKDDRIDYEVEELRKDIDEFRKLVIPWQNDAIHKMKIENLRLKNEVEKVNSEKQGYIEKIERQEQYITNLKTKIDDMKADALRAEMGRKVLVASSIKVGPRKSNMDDTFLVEPYELLDVDKCVAKYGGELDSFYEEIETDKKDKNGFEPGHELSERNYFLRLMKTVGTARFFQKRIKDNAEVKETEAKVGKLFPGHYDKQSERQKERDRILRNRFISLNKIIECGNLTNQEKLMMYAMNSPYHNTNIERLLNYAGNFCMNAEYLITILEDPDTCGTYENTIAFLDQFASPSEFKMKLDFARELIEGKWYIMGEYNGRETKFQLVPIDEFNELRKAAGLPISEFCYKDDKEKDKDRKNDTVKSDIGDSIDAAGPKKPDFVENMTSGVGTVDLPDDGLKMPEIDETLPVEGKKE